MFRRKRKSKLAETAEGIGRRLGRIAARLDSWKAERDLIASEVKNVVAAGQRMLADLGESAHEATAEIRSARKGLERVGSRMSAKARTAISDAQRKRWAFQKAAAKKR
jgi:ElaB/YqjD/DUF883 family membrane-anchored ribosome-binding protein